MDIAKKDGLLNNATKKKGRKNKVRNLKYASNFIGPGKSDAFAMLVYKRHWNWDLN